jgi:transposase-like protein
LKFKIQSNHRGAGPDLAKVGREFATFRGQTGRNKNYPARLKQMAVDALASGSSASEVAKAVKVSVYSIMNWKKTVIPSSSPAPRELTVTEAPEAAPRLAEQNMASIHLLCGVRIDLPVSALTSSFLKSINQGGQL